jgi:transcriptional regulator with XRE-family HTH domain
LVRPPKKSQLSFDIRDLVGVQIRRRRTEAGLSQQLLADQCGILRTYLSCIENGTANPTIKVLASLAVALNVDIGEMFKY